MSIELHVDPAYHRTCRVVGEPGTPETTVGPGQTVTIDHDGSQESLLEVRVSPLEDISIHGGEISHSADSSSRPARLRLTVDSDYEGIYCFASEPTGREFDVRPGGSVNITSGGTGSPLIVAVAGDGALAMHGYDVVMTDDVGRQLYP